MCRRRRHQVTGADPGAKDHHYGMTGLIHEVPFEVNRRRSKGGGATITIQSLPVQDKRDPRSPRNYFYTDVSLSLRIGDAEQDGEQDGDAISVRPFSRARLPQARHSVKWYKIKSTVSLGHVSGPLKGLTTLNISTFNPLP